MEGAKNWKTAEYIAALLEKTISPDAKVQHNVFLPVVGRPDRKPRQCDVVVTYGKEPRTSFAIVEVQKRNKKPDINTFHGWVAKMREVGAQQLICVSVHGYPRSIIDEVALRIGPTVKLMTLRQLEEGDQVTRLIMLPYMLHTNCTFELLSFGTLKLDREDRERSRSSVQISNTDAVFSVGKDGQVMDLNELVANVLKNTDLASYPPIPESSIETELRFSSEYDLWFRSDAGIRKVKEWSVRVKLSFHTSPRSDIKTDVTHLVYRQEMIDGVVAWMATVKIEVDGAQHDFQIMFKRDADGYLSLTGFSK